MDLTSFDRVKWTKYVVFLVSTRVLEGFQANSLVFWPISLFLVSNPYISHVLSRLIWFLGVSDTI